MPRNPQFSEAQWEQMKPWLMQEYVQKDRTAIAVAADVLSKFGRVMTTRQLKNRMTRKWEVPKKVEADLYQAMYCILCVKGHHITFRIPRLLRTRTHKYNSVRKEIHRKKSVVKTHTQQDLIDSFVALRGASAEIHGLGDNPYDCIPSDVNSFDDAREGHDGSPSDADDLSESPPLSPFAKEQPTDTSTQLCGDMCLRETPSLDLARWLADRFYLISIERDDPDERNFEIPQNDGADTISKMLIRAIMSVPPHDQDRRVLEEVLDCKLGTISKDWRWEKRTDKLAVEFANYYIQQCLVSMHPDLDSFDHIERVASRSILSELFIARTGELLEVLWWVMTIISTHHKVHQLEGLFEDIFACIETINDDYTRAMRPMFEIARRANAEYIEIIHTDFEYQRSSDTALESELRQNIQHLRRFNMHKTGDFVITHMFLAWHLCATGRPVESLNVLLGPDCLPLGEKILGTHHIAVLNCGAIAARCYHQQQNMLATSHVDSSVLRLRQCTKPLRAYRNMIKRQQAVIYIDQGQRIEGFKKLIEVADERLQAWGPDSNAVWSVVNQITSLTRSSQERQLADEFERKVRATHTARGSRESQ